MANSLKTLTLLIDFIEDEEHYYAMFPHVITNAAFCIQELQTLFNANVISDEEYNSFSSRIDVAKRKAIETHLAWTVKHLSENKNHTVETVVYSVYNDIFPGYIPEKK